MGPVERAIRASLHEGMDLSTPSQHKPFRVHRIDSRGVVLLLAMAHETRIDWACWEGAAHFLAGRKWVPCAGRHSVDSEPGTFDEYMKEHGPARDTTNWAAEVLRVAGVVDLVNSPRLEMRLRAGFGD